MGLPGAGHPPAEGGGQGILAAWREAGTTSRQLVTVRALRSISQGALAVDFVLYLRSLGWNATAIGLLLMGGSLAGAVFSLLIGVASDRLGRRRFLLGYEAALAVLTTALLLARSLTVLAVAAVLFGFGRGANGTAGPFGPAEQAWLAQDLPPRHRSALFSLNAAAGFVGMGIGASLAALFARLTPALAAWHLTPYTAIFWLTAAVAALNLYQIWVLPERPPEPPAPARPLAESRMRRQENRDLVRFGLLNAVNALGVTMVAPLLPYWFAVRYHLGAAHIAPLYGLTFFLAGPLSLAVGSAAGRMGMARLIVLLRLVSVVLLAFLPFAPTFALAGVLFLLRSVSNQSTFGVRQAFGTALVRNERRGLAAALNVVTFNLPAALGPVVAGWLFDRGSFVLPFLLSAGLQLLYALLFERVMGSATRRVETV